MFKAIVSWWSRCLSEPNGNPSSRRVQAMLATVTALVCCVRQTWTSGLNDSCALLLAALCGVTAGAVAFFRKQENPSGREPSKEP